MKSSKRVLDLEECCHKFRTTFIKGNCDKGVFVSVGDDSHFYELNKEVELSEPDWGVLRDVNKVRGFYVPTNYDPFKEVENAI